MTTISIKHNPKLCQLLDDCIASIVYPFDATDVDYLVSHLTLVQLRREIHHADVRFSVLRTLGEIPDFPWGYYRDACRLALKLKLAEAPIPRRGGNHGSFDIQEVKRANDVVDVISRFTELRKSGWNFTGLCPLHDDTHPSFFVYPETQSWHCFGCNRGGDVIDFIKLINSVDTREACELLAGGVR